MTGRPNANSLLASRPYLKRGANPSHIFSSRGQVPITTVAPKLDRLELVTLRLPPNDMGCMVGDHPRFQQGRGRREASQNVLPRAHVTVVKDQGFLHICAAAVAVTVPEAAHISFVSSLFSPSQPSRPKSSLGRPTPADHHTI